MKKIKMEKVKDFTLEGNLPVYAFYEEEEGRGGINRRLIGYFADEEMSREVGCYQEAISKDGKILHAYKNFKTGEVFYKDVRARFLMK